VLTLLKPASRAPRATRITTELPPVGTELWSIDLETNGLNAADPACFIVGIGLANDDDCFYINLLGASDTLRCEVKSWLRAAKLIAFNANFDGTFLQAWLGQWPNMVGCAYALFKALSSEGFNGQSWSLESAEYNVLGWTTSNKDALTAALKERGLGKGDMWQLPVEILGPYCASDADAAWQLWHELQAQAGSPAIMAYHTLVMTEIRLLAAQQLRGIQVDETLLTTCHRELIAKIDSSMNSFLNSPEVAPHIGRTNSLVHDAWSASEPPALTAKGLPSARHQAWIDREATWMASRGFNPNSKPQLATLFYDQLGYKPHSLTETGRRSIDRKVLPSLGAPGKLLSQYNLYVKRRGYVEAVIAKSRRDGCIHPQFNSVGTVTTRLGGSGGLNMQQMPKDPAFMASLAARPGYKLVQADAEALEPTILAEFSQDKTLLALYGPDAKTQDIYLFVAAKIPALGREILRYYDPENPTKEGIAAAKKHCKRERGIAKTVTLAANYNAGAPKIHETLKLGGIDISLAEVRQILREYWRLFAGVKLFETWLSDMWANNGGWILSILGTPICVSEQFVKDINNRFCQTSGHMVLQLWIHHSAQALDESGIEWHPWLIDCHDEMLIEVPEAQAATAALCITEGLARTNAELGMGIKIKGPAQIADNLASIKCENYLEWLEQQRD